MANLLDIKITTILQEHSKEWPKYRAIYDAYFELGAIEKKLWKSKNSAEQALDALNYKLKNGHDGFQNNVEVFIKLERNLRKMNEVLDKVHRIHAELDSIAEKLQKEIQKSAKKKSEMTADAKEDAAKMDTNDDRSPIGLEFIQESQIEGIFFCTICDCGVTQQDDHAKSSDHHKKVKKAAAERRK